jgi:drug/metabolite transporter (DMT)-like permease
MHSHREGLYSVHAAVLIFGLTALFSKIIQLNALEITLLRSIFAALAIVIYILLLKETLLLTNRRDYLIAMILGILLGTHWITYFHSMQIASISIGIIALYTYPVITVFLEPFFHGEKPHVKDIISACAVFGGIYLLVPEFSISNQTTQGVFWGVLSAFLFAMRNIIHGRYFQSYPARHALFYQTLVIILMLLPFTELSFIEVTSEQWFQLLLLGVFFTALPHTLFANSLRHLKAKTVGLIGCMQVLYGTVFAAIFLAELPDWKTIFGGIIVISAAVYETISTSRKQS